MTGLWAESALVVAPSFGLARKRPSHLSSVESRSFHVKPEARSSQFLVNTTPKGCGPIRSHPDATTIGHTPDLLGANRQGAPCQPPLELRRQSEARSFHVKLMVANAEVRSDSNAPSEAAQTSR